MKGFALAFIPGSWGLGSWPRPHKTAYALGPLRLIVYHSLAPWRSYDGAKRDHYADPRLERIAAVVRAASRREQQ